MFNLVPINRTRRYYRPFSLDSFFDESFHTSPMRGEWNPAVEVAETENEILFTVDLPGLEQKDIEINIEDGILSFSGERSFESEESKEYVRRERFYGKFSRSFRLPKLADVEKISANLKNGVLTVTVPKKEEARPRQIEVKVN